MNKFLQPNKPRGSRGSPMIPQPWLLRSPKPRWKEIGRKKQKKILKNRDDDKAKLRLKTLEKFKTTNDYDFSHVLIADYGLNADLFEALPALSVEIDKLNTIEK